MAKKSAGKNVRKSRRTQNLNEMPVMNERESVRTQRSARSRNSGEDRDMKEILREFISSPAVKYIAGGLATALLTRLANNLSGRYPEISGFIRDNMSTLEERFGGEWGLNRENTASSRH